MNKHIIKFSLATLLLLVLTTSCCHKKDEEKVINAIINRVWFTTKEERWNTDYSDNYIPESYRSWSYYKIPGSENWLWYFFDNNEGYEIHTKDYDTTYYHFEYSYRYKDNSLYVSYETVDGSTEEYNVQLEQLDEDNLIWQHEYRSHSFEKVTNENVTGDSKRGGVINLNPKNVKRKPSGPMIQAE